VLRTERLLLRRWLPGDLDALAALNADAEVMEHFPSVLSRRASAAALRRLDETFEQNGYGFWAAELVGDGALIGFIGLQPVPDDLPIAPAVEVGWRLARPYWGRSLAFEGARTAITFAFESLGVGEVLAYTAVTNTRSRRLMERLGMRHDPQADFIHPKLPRRHRLQPHVVYRVSAERWTRTEDS
jgi:RimJ/RimL family protein N-acetyltransferase